MITFLVIYSRSQRAPTGYRSRSDSVALALPAKLSGIQSSPSYDQGFPAQSRPLRTRPQTPSWPLAENFLMGARGKRIAILSIGSLPAGHVGLALPAKPQAYARGL